jgi:MoaA/NifB/PqqE/SkfB family radical SAM enzyme
MGHDVPISIGLVNLELNSSCNLRCRRCLKDASGGREGMIPSRTLLYGGGNLFSIQGDRGA